MPDAPRGGHLTLDQTASVLGVPVDVVNSSLLNSLSFCERSDGRRYFDPKSVHDGAERRICVGANLDCESNKFYVVVFNSTNSIVVRYNSTSYESSLFKHAIRGSVAKSDNSNHFRYTMSNQVL
jgi:hypothetical protein